MLKDGDKISMGGATILEFTYQDDLEERFSKSLYESAVKDGLITSVGWPHATTVASRQATRINFELA